MGFPQEFPPKTNAIIIVLYYPSEQLIKQTIFSVGEPISGAIICSGSMEINGNKNLKICKTSSLEDDLIG